MELFLKNPRLFFEKVGLKAALGNLLVRGLEYTGDQVLQMIASSHPVTQIHKANASDMYVELSRFGFGAPEIRKIVASAHQFEALPIVFSMPAGNLRQMRSYLLDYIELPTLKRIILEQPLLTTVEFSNFFMKKVQLLRTLKFSDEQIFRFLEKYPGVFVKYARLSAGV